MNKFFSIVLLMLALSCSAVAQITVKVSQLPASSTLTGTEYVPVTQGGVSKKATTKDIAKLASKDSAVLDSINRRVAFRDTLTAGKIASKEYVKQQISTFVCANADSFGTISTGSQYRLAYYPENGNRLSEAGAITPSRVLISDANGVPTHSSVTTTELGFSSGVTSAIQTQINTKQQTLVSGTNIRTINGNSLLGSGDIAIIGGSGSGSIPPLDTVLKYGNNASKDITFHNDVLGGDLVIGKDSTAVFDFGPFHFATYVNVLRAKMSGQLEQMNTVIKPDTIRTQYVKIVPSSGSAGYAVLSCVSTLGLPGEFQLPPNPDGFVLLATNQTAGYRLQASLSGNGSTTTFTVTHANLTGLGYTAAATSVLVSPTSAAAAPPYYITNITNTSFDIVYLTAPASGTNNITFDYVLKY